MPRKRTQPALSEAEKSKLETRMRARAARRLLRERLSSGADRLQEGCMVPFYALEERLKNGELSKRKVSEASTKTYKGIWLEWLMYLVAEGVSWRDAKPIDVANFLMTGLRPRNFARNAGGQVSEVTQARYAKVLEKVYQHAIAADEHMVNPVALKSAGVKATESVPSLKLNTLQRADLLAKLPAEQDAIGIRDRLVICLTLLEGMTCADVMGMKLGDLLACPEAPESPHLDCSDAGAERLASWERIHTHAEGAGGMLLARGYAPAGVHLRGARPAQERRLGFTATTREALFAWLNVRGECSGSSSTDVVVLSLSRRKGKRLGGASYRTLFQICSAHIDTAMQGSVTMTADELRSLMHIGPNALRNACLLEWLEVKKLPLEEVCRRAGLKETRSLGRTWNAAQGGWEPSTRTEKAREEAPIN